MDSVASVWFWLWLWLLLVVVVVVVRALAVPSSLSRTCPLTFWSPLSEPDSSSPTARREQARRLQNGRKRRIGAQARISRGRSMSNSSSNIFGFSSESSQFSSFSSRLASTASSSRSSSASDTSAPPVYMPPQASEASEKANMQAAFEDFLKVFFLGYLFHCQQQRLQEQQQCPPSVSTGTQTESVLPSPSTAASTWTAADLDAMEQAEEMEQTGRQTGQQAGHQVEQTNAQTAEQASGQAVEQQERANGDIP